MPLNNLQRVPSCYLHVHLPAGVFKSVLDSTRSDSRSKDEIFVDVVERLTCTFNASGYLAASQVGRSWGLNAVALVDHD